MLHMLQWSYTYGVSVYPQCYYFPDVCCSVFILMLHMFYTYIASVLSRCCVCLQCFSSVFHVFQTHVSSVSFVFCLCCKCCIYMFQVDRVLHMRCAWEAGGARAVPAWTRSPGGPGDAAPAWARVTQARTNDVWAMRAHAWTRENGLQSCPSVQTSRC
jgi:hypothetical protein